MKADILRRAEEVTDSEDETGVLNAAANVGKGKGRDVAFEDELDDLGVVRIGGDGEDSASEGGEDDIDEQGGTSTTTARPEVTLELAYIANPKAFERDAATRRSKERIALRAQTGASLLNCFGAECCSCDLIGCSTTYLLLYRMVR